MGWKDIFAKRRLPPERAAAATRAADGGESAEQRALTAALECLAAQMPAGPQVPGLGGLAAGYLAGYVAAKGGGKDPAVADIPPGALPSGLVPDFENASASGRLIGRHEAQCGTRRLFAAAASCLAGDIGFDKLLTACDNAADRLQTHNPAHNFRFTAEERALLGNDFGRGRSAA